jgi:uncharacterized protein YndB with AHSA1/START domain
MSEYGIVTAPGALRFERVLPGPIERVWAYLTESDKRGMWLAAGEMELRVGGRVEHIFRNSELTTADDAPPPKYAEQAGEVRVRGRVTACDPPRLLSYTWEGQPGEDSEVRFELTPVGDKVRLVVTHSRLLRRDELVGAAGGWHAHLGILEDRLNDRAPRPFWATHTRLEAEYAKQLPKSGPVGALEN